MMDSPFTVNNRPPVKEIALAVSLLVFGMLGIIVGTFMASNRVGGDRAHGTFLFCFVFLLQFCPSSNVNLCSVLENIQGCFSRCWELSCLFRVSITRGLLTMLTRVTRVSPSPTYLLSKCSKFQHFSTLVQIFFTVYVVPPSRLSFDY